MDMTWLELNIWNVESIWCFDEFSSTFNNSTGRIELIECGYIIEMSNEYC